MLKEKYEMWSIFFSFYLSTSSLLSICLFAFFPIFRLHCLMSLKIYCYQDIFYRLGLFRWSSNRESLFVFQHRSVRERFPSGDDHHPSFTHFRSKECKMSMGFYSKHKVCPTFLKYLLDKTINTKSNIKSIKNC